MRILVISDKEDKSLLGKAIKEGMRALPEKAGDAYSFYELGDEDLRFCIGCFTCWVKTPGLCVFKDLGRELNREFMDSDVAVILSPVKYGCYSRTIKRVWDRTIPVVLPFFVKIDGEMHHAPRYSRYPRLVIVGYGENISDFEAETFKSLNDANAVNFQTEEARTYICRREADIPGVLEAVNSYLKEKGGEMNEKSILRQR